MRMGGCAGAYGLATVTPGIGREQCIGSWAMIDRESDGRFIASIPDLEDLAAYGDTDKDAVAHVAELAGERVRAAVEGGQPVPPRR
jgi:predicted RNase H-like HicB family nuclease